MAPKAMKRPAAASMGGAKKKPADVTAVKCHEVAEALKDVEALPETCRNMLAAMIKDSLTVYAAERHPFQSQIVQMAADTLSGMKAKLEQDIAQAQASVGSADTEKASRTAACEAAGAKFTALEAAAAAAKEAAETDRQALKDAQSADKAAAAAIVAKDAELATVGEKKAKLDSTMKETYEPLKSAKGERNAIAILGKICKEFDVEASLADSLLETFKKEPEERQTFDGIVIKEVEAFLTAKMAEMETTEKEGDSQKAACASAKEAAEAAKTAASDKFDASTQALSAAESAKVEGKAALAAATAAVASYEGDMKAAAQGLEAAKVALTSFLDGPMKSFEDLKDLAPPPPPPEPEPEVVEAAVPEAAPVAEAPAAAAGAAEVAAVA